MIYSAPQDLHSHPIIEVSSSLDWIGGEIDELRLRLGKAAGSISGVLHLLLLLASSVPVQAPLPL